MPRRRWTGFAPLILFLLAAPVIFRSYGRHTVERRWRELNSPTPIPNSFLPPEVNEALYCLDQVNAVEFQVAGFCNTDNAFCQRLGEGAWPRRHRAQTQLTVIAVDDITRCLNFKVLCTRGDVDVGYCAL